MYTPKTMYHRGGKTSQLESVRLKINGHMTSVGEEILCVLDKQQRGVDVYSVTLNVRVFVLERLSAVGEFICSLIQREIETLETQLLETQNKLLDVDFMDIYPNTAEVSSELEEKRSPSVVQDEPQHEERRPGLVQDEPQPPQIKQEEDDDGNESTLTLLHRTAMCDTLSDSHDGAEEDTAVGKKPKKERQIVQKRRRMMGQSYIGKSKGAEVNNKPRVMGPRCQSAACVKSSKFHCSDIGEADREKIFKCYWENMNWEEKKMYVQGLIDVAPVKRRRGSSQRSCARVFFLNVSGQRRRVCRSFFLSTLGIKAWSAFNWTMDPGNAQKNAASPDRDVLLFPVCKEISSDEERSPGLVQEEPQPPHIKDEQEELLQRPEEVDRPMLTLLAVKSADDDGGNRQTDPVASTSSTEHMKTQAYIKYWVRSQP